MVAISEIKEKVNKTSLTTFKVYKSASQALTTEDELIDVGAAYETVLTAIANLNEVLDKLFITADKPNQKQLIGVLKAAIDLAQMALDLVENSTLQKQMNELTQNIKDELSFTKEILSDLILVHIEMPKMPPVKYSNKIKAMFA